MRHIRSIVAFIVAVVLPFCADAATWSFTPGVEATLTYADNITLAPKGQEEDDVVLGVKPQIGIHGTGARMQLGLNYSIDNLFYARDKGRNESRQFLLSNANAEVLPDLAYVEATGLISYQAIDPTTSAGLGRLAVTESTGEVATWTLSPYIKRSRGGVFSFKTGMKLDVVDYNGFLRDSYAREVFFDISSGPDFQKILWQFVTSDYAINYKGDTSDYTRSMAELNLSYRLTSEWAIVTKVGYENYDYPYNPLVAHAPDGNYWRAGIGWTPTPRTNVELGVGEHFFGKTSYGVVSHQGRRFYADATYEEDVTSQRQLQIELAQVQTIDPFTRDPITTNVSYLSETEQVFLSKKSRLRTGYKSIKIAAEVSAYREHRDFQETQGTEQVAGGSASLEWFWSGRTSLAIRSSQEGLESATGSTIRSRDVTVSLRRKFSTRASGSIDAQRGVRSSTDVAVNDTVAHVITLRVQVGF